MQSKRKEIFSLLRMISKHAKRVLAVSLIVTLVLPVTVPVQSGTVYAEANQTAGYYMDKIVFGNTESEQEHNFEGDFTNVISGGLGESARVSLPRIPEDIQGGELTFTMNVDPVAQNYFTLKFWGDDASSYKSIVYINGEQIGYRRNGDYEAINIGISKGLPNRFYYNTIMLPLEATQGQETVQIIVRTFSGDFGGKVNMLSRGYYNAYTHTQSYLNVNGETQGVKFQDENSLLRADITDSDKQAIIDGYTQSQIKLFNDHSATVDRSAGAKLSIVRYEDDLRFYANALHYDWSPAKTPELKKAALERIFKVIDNHVKDYYGNTRIVTRGGHQGDWGGYYGALGEAFCVPGFARSTLYHGGRRR
ncbi:hypothetical protein [Paenibacillus sedimenti]|uniref:Uncharacterized protein n=1 Tax=Paenibacillus sedimenti TaxID=2770274 RepID=A0A926KJ00_9BACL|nr:hypothetical protein [Paenibacillus sedimenti]MBD0378589.1 hypothetical protein [Paenibacillus sedimenti]